MIALSHSKYSLESSQVFDIDFWSQQLQPLSVFDDNQVPARPHNCGACMQQHVAPEILSVPSATHRVPLSNPELTNSVGLILIVVGDFIPPPPPP